MSFKKNLIAFFIILVTASIITIMALPWADPGLALGSLGLLAEYPFVLVLIIGIVIAGLVSDRVG